jgi:hypothetical protein
MVYCISVEPELFDLFFNSWNGYRAQYFRDPDYGQARNIEFIKAISPGLLTPRGAVPNPQLATTSLAGGSAKVWLAEVGKGFCAQCAGEWRTAQNEEPEIANDRWELSVAPDSRKGRKAPFLTKLRIIGAHVNDSASEYVAVQKRQRAKQIYDIGWS